MKFYKYKTISSFGFGVELFDVKYKKYGGHGHNLAYLFGLDKLIIEINNHFLIGYTHEWYDYQRHYLCLGFMHIVWLGRPFWDLS